jgi:hypothetical protein
MRKRLFFQSKRNDSEAGVALITSLLLLFLMSSLLVGFMILLATNQQLAGSNNDDVTAFYAAEAGLEQMTSNLGDLFAQTYSPTGAQINAIQLNPPLVPGITYADTNGTGYSITAAAYDSNGNPAPTVATIKSGPYVGMTALLTEYTMVVNARTTAGREVKLQRTTQTVGIPMFQFGIFSNTDLSFFPGPNFQFGGRTHTNGNLFLATGATLTLSDKVDAYKDVIRTTLENGWPTSNGYTGTVQVTTQPGSSNYRNLGMSEGSLQGGIGSGADTNWPTISTGSAPTDYNSNLINGQGSAFPQYSTGAKQLNLGIVTIGGGSTQSIDLLRRPISGEQANITGERYFAQASLKILLSDDPADIMNLPCIDGSTQPFDLSQMSAPVNTWSTSAYGPLKALYNAMTANHVTPLPLATSGAFAGTGGAYNTGAYSDGYWLPTGYPIIRGYLKIEEQVGYGSPCGTWRDVTVEILSYGYVGKNIDPVSQSFNGTSLNPQWPGSTAAMDPVTYNNGGSPATWTVTGGAFSIATPGKGYYPMPNLPWTGTVTGTPATNPPTPVELASSHPNPAGNLSAGNFTAINTLTSPTGNCLDPHPYAVIRLERIRDNPTSLYVGGFVATGALSGSNKPKIATVAAACGVDPATGQLPVFASGTWVPQGYDFWPNTLFDTREGTLRDSPMSNGAASTLPPVTLNGVMHYIEIDANNLTQWFGGAITVGATSITTSGQNTLDPVVAPNDFLVYVSDRRGNYSLSQSIAGGWPPLSYTNKETGEYGWNDLVNFPTNSTTGCPTNALETGEDADGTNVLYTYGANQTYLQAASPTTPLTLAQVMASYGRIGVFNGLSGTAFSANTACTGVPSYASAGGIWPMLVAPGNAARENPAMFFRRAVKLVNGANLGGVGTCPGGNNCGLSFASENPVYIQGDFNANYGGSQFNTTAGTIAASVAGDAVTLLSDNWNDTNSFSSPWSTNGRTAGTAWYRVAVIGGAEPYFSNPSGVVERDYGTDGGVHNFLRYLEAWGGTLNYEGSIIDLFYSRQANGNFKCCNTVYGAPTRGYKFDTNFLTPSLLPPRTPLFRDVNTTGWTRLLTPNASSGNQ